MKQIIGLMCILSILLSVAYAEDKTDLEHLSETHDLKDSAIAAFMEIQADLVLTDSGLRIQNETVTAHHFFDNQGNYASSPDLREELIFDQADNIIEKYIYDPNNNIVSEEIRIYNLQGILVESIESYFNAEAYVVRKRVTTNNDNGDLIETSDTAYQLNGQTAQNIYTYNEQGDWIEVYRSSFDGSFSKLNYEYDDQGNQTKIYRYSNDDLVNYDLFEFDEQGKQTQMTRYNANGDLLEAFKSKYDALSNRIESQWFDSQNEKIATTKFKHDSEGNIIEEMMSGRDDVVFQHKTFSYNENGEWLEILTYSDEALVDRVVFNYDEQGKRLDSIRYNASNEILGIHGCKYEYDVHLNWTRQECVTYSNDSGEWKPNYDLGTLELTTRIIGYHNTNN